MSRRITVAIDGPAGAGKSTVSKALAQRLGYTLVETGAVYRAVALRAHELGVALDDLEALARIAAELDIDFHWVAGVNHVYVGGKDVSQALRSPEVSQAASKVSAVPAVRAALLELQRRLAGGGGAVLEGRDIGTVVFPQAEAKFFLTAREDVRARRRWDEMRARGGEVPSFEEVLREQRERDARDAERPVAPLKPAHDSVVVDSSDRSADQVVAEMERVVRARAAR